MENKLVYYDYKTYTEILELINVLVDELDKINYDKENQENTQHRKNIEDIHKTLTEKLSNYIQEKRA